MNSGLQVQIEHLLKRCIAGLDDRRASGEAADSVREDVEPAETLHNLIDQGGDAGAVQDVRCHGSESWVVEVRRLDFPGGANDRRTGVKERPGHIGSKAAVGPGYKYDLVVHEVLH